MQKRRKEKGETQRSRSEEKARQILCLFVKYFSEESYFRTEKNLRSERMRELQTGRDTNNSDHERRNTVTGLITVTQDKLELFGFTEQSSLIYQYTKERVEKDTE